MTLESSSLTVTRPQHISLLFDLILPRCPFQAAYFSLWLVPLPAVSASGLPHVSSESDDEEKEMFLAWFPVTFRSHGRTEKCKISIMKIYKK